MLDTARPWSWTQFAIALGLIPLSFLVWLVVMVSGVVRDPQPRCRLPGWRCRPGRDPRAGVLLPSRCSRLVAARRAAGRHAPGGLCLGCSPLDRGYLGE